MHDRDDDSAAPRTRPAQAVIDAETYRQLGHRMVDMLADYYASIAERSVTRWESWDQVARVVGDRSLPEAGISVDDLGPFIEETTRTLIEHSLHTASPRFLGYVLGSPNPLGALGDLLASSLNVCADAFDLAPIGTHIELQTIRWLAEFVGYAPGCSGILTSGGTMANIVALLVARRLRAPWDVRQHGLRAPTASPLRVYASAETHEWLYEAVDMAGMGIDAIRWIKTNRERKLDRGLLAAQVEEDRRRGDFPLMVVGNAGTTATGTVDELVALGEYCGAQGIWFHVDGAYGAPAAGVEGAPPDLDHLAVADSLALDPHKWFYAPVDVGAILTRHTDALFRTFSYRAPPYHFAADDQDVHLYEYGPQTTRSFRALKVWLCLQQLGRAQHKRLIAEDIRLARRCYELAEQHPELEAVACGLSVTTFRYVPPAVRDRLGEPGMDDFLDRLNEEILARTHERGRVFLMNTRVDGRLVLRTCVVNFRTSEPDIATALAEVVEVGRAVFAARGAFR